MSHKYLVNSNTGAVFTWNAVWAKYPHMIPTNERPTDPKKFVRDNVETGLVNTKVSPSSDHQVSKDDDSSVSAGEETPVLSEDEIEILAQAIKSTKSKTALVTLARENLGLEIESHPSVKLTSMKSVLNKRLKAMSEAVSQ